MPAANMVPQAPFVQRILDAIAREQLAQKNLGMVNTATGLALAIVIVGRVASEGETSLDPTGET